MRRLLLVLTLILSWPGLALAAISFGQAVSCTSAGVTGCTTPGTTTTGSVFVAQTGYWEGGSAFTSVSDSKSNTWTNVIAAFTDGSAQTSGRVDAVNGGGTGGAAPTVPPVGRVGLSGRAWGV